jgi:hypothetical protein
MSRQKKAYMADARVVILSTRSLFVEGVANRLKQHLPEERVKVVDARQTDALEQVIAAQPTSVILDATDAEATKNCPLGKMLNALPLLKVIRLDPQKDKIQVVVSEQRVVEQVSDLIEVIKSSAVDQPSAHS